MNDFIAPYLFAHAPIRIQAVRMTDAWQALHESHHLSEGVAHMLGRCAAATALLATTIKFEGRVSVQLQSQGPLRLLLCQATHELGLRGMARVAEGETLAQSVGRDSLRGLSTGGHIAITIENQKEDKRYQGITPVVEDSLARSFEHYFEQSEQLPTRLWLAANNEVATGFMLQRMPGEQAHHGDHWNRAQHLAETLTNEEMLALQPEELIHRLYHEEDLRRLEPRSLHFECRCSREKVQSMLQGLGQAEIDDILQEQGRIDVNCDFCGQAYQFDAVDAAALFADGINSKGSGTLQ